MPFAASSVDVQGLMPPISLALPVMIACLFHFQNHVALGKRKFGPDKLGDW